MSETKRFDDQPTPLPYGNERMPNFDFGPISGKIAEIHRETDALKDAEPNQAFEQTFLGLAGDGTLISVNEYPYAKEGEVRYIVHTGLAADLSTDGTLDRAEPIDDIELSVLRLRDSTAAGVLRARNGSVTIAIGDRALWIPSPDTRDRDDNATLGVFGIVPLKPVEPEQNVKLGPPDWHQDKEGQVDPEEERKNRLIERNITSVRDILGKNQSEVYDRQTQERVTSGVVRRIGLDVPGERILYPGFRNTEVSEHVDPVRQSSFYVIRGYARVEGKRFYDKHCVWMLDPNKREYKVSVRNDDGTYTEHDMTIDDHRQLRLSVLADTDPKKPNSAYGEAIHKKYPRALWEEEVPPGVKAASALGRVGIGRRRQR